MGLTVPTSYQWHLLTGVVVIIKWGDRMWNTWNSAWLLVSLRVEKAQECCWGEWGQEQPRKMFESAFLAFFRRSHTQPGRGGRWGGRLRSARIKAFLLLIFCYFIALTCCNRKWHPQPPAGTLSLLCAGSALASALDVCQFLSPPGHPARRATSFLLLYWDARRRARTWPRPSESQLSLLFSIFMISLIWTIF